MWIAQNGWWLWPVLTAALSILFQNKDKLHPRVRAVIDLAISAGFDAPRVAFAVKQLAEKRPYKKPSDAVVVVYEGEEATQIKEKPE